MLSYMFVKLTVLSLVFLLGFSVYVRDAEAKTLPQISKGSVKSSVSRSAGTTISVFPKLRLDRRALLVNFSNLQNALSVSYMLIYKTSEQEEAASGALNLGGTASTSELLFGTCSKNVCRYHTGIHDARLEVSYTSKNGKKYLKKFKIRV